MVGVLIGIFFYELSDTVLYLVQPLFFPTFLRFIGLAVTIYYLSKASYGKFGDDISLLFNFMIIWTILMLFRGSLIGNFIPGGSASPVDIVRRAFLNSFGAMTFFIPLMALMSVNMNCLYYIKKYAIFFCLIALFMTFLARDQIAYSQHSFGMTTIEDVNGDFISVRNLIHAAFPGYGFILFGLFCNKYIKGLYAVFFPIAILLFFIVMAIGGGRGDTIFNLIYLIVYLYLMIRYSINLDNGLFKEKHEIHYGRFVAFILGTGFVVLLIYLYERTEIFDYVLERAFGGKELSTNIGSESRDILVKNFSEDFNAHPLDWIWGRGVNGSYATSHLGIGGRRAWMEWGYLYLILKGGIIYLILFVLLLLHASYLGFRRSNNMFSKCLAMMCLVLLFDLTSTNAEPQFSTQFVLTWFCFGLLERKEIRLMSDADIYGYFNYKNYKKIGN